MAGADGNVFHARPGGQAPAGRNGGGRARDRSRIRPRRGPGQPPVGAGALTLSYDDDGWFGSDIYADVSAYRYLVLRLAGAHGGEQNDFHLRFGGIEHRFADLVLDGGRTPVVTTAFQDIRIPMTANGMNTRDNRDLQLSFWWGGRSDLIIDEIHFE